MDYRIAIYWARGPLSFLEQLSMTSFLRQGFDVELYSYADVPNVPPGVTLCDAADIQPEGLPTDHFRWQLLSTLESRIWIRQISLRKIRLLFAMDICWAGQMNIRSAKMSLRFREIAQRFSRCAIALRINPGPRHFKQPARFVTRGPKKCFTRIHSKRANV